MRDIYLHPTVAKLADYLRAPQMAAVAASEPMLTHRASNLAIWATGFGQLIFYAAYWYAALWLINDGLDWVYDALDDAPVLYMRCVVLSAGVFFGLSGFAIAAKWLLVGRWKA
ncbi:peptide synthetase, partial [bacterium M00.F.Ca.ET.152.01.1.1]